MLKAVFSSSLFSGRNRRQESAVGGFWIVRGDLSITRGALRLESGGGE